MCLNSVKVFEKPVKEMIGWKILGYKYSYGTLCTPFLYVPIKKGQKYLIAKGKKIVEDVIDCKVYSGGFIHAYKTRKDARKHKGFDSIIVKVKCHNVSAIGTNNDLVCNKIEFIWPKKKK